MTHATVDSALHALASVDLGPTLLHAAPAAAAAVNDANDQQDGTASGTVVGSSLVSFSALVSAQHKSDLNNALALAQLVAVKQGHDPNADPVGYYQFLASFLSQIGFTAQGITFGQYTPQAKTVEIDQVVLEILQQVLAPDAIGTVTAALKALEGSADSGGAPWAIYSSNSVSNNAGTFTVGLANETNGSVAFQLGGFSFSGTETTTKFLWMTYSTTSISIKDGTTTFSLNDDVYSQVRAAVLAKLGSHAQGFVANLPDL